MDEGICSFSIEGDYDGDVATFYDEKTVMARKPHQCFECREPIQRGEQYLRASGKWEQKIETYHFCLACVEVTAEFVDGARNFGVLWDEMVSNWEEGAHLQACLNRLTTKRAKEHMRRRWMKWKGLADLELKRAEPDGRDPGAP